MLVPTIISFGFPKLVLNEKDVYLKKMIYNCEY